MVSINEISVHFGGRTLFEEISFLINKQDRIGLAGRNGAGKSTLLKIIAGEQTPDSGEVTKPNTCTIGYLPQDMTHQPGKTVFDETASAFTEVQALEKKIAQVNEQIATRTDYESDEYMQLIHDMHDYGERMNHLGGYSLHADIESTLLGLGFERSDFTRNTEDFSGGWRMRIELAKLLLRKPDLLLLDEPTNHLDIESIQWLEDFLKNYFGAVLMVSHDKAFLDNITTRTIEITMGRIYDYKSNYSKYLLLRKERKESQIAAAKNQQKYIDKTKVLINKFRAKKDKAAFAQSLIKKLDKLEVVEVDEEDTSSLKFKFPPAPRSSRLVVIAEDAKKQYGDNLIFSHVNFRIDRGDRVAFVGRNGEGKSTMSRIIVGEEKCEGVLRVGESVDVGYYAQNQAEILNGKLTVLETIDEVAKGDSRKNVRAILGSFLFSGDDVFKQVQVLSGGEKGRLAMCKLLLQPHSLLVLDEPTNHLDMRSKDVLKTALQQYDGTLILVSHDRDFLQGLTNRVFEFRHGNVKQHAGDINEYLRDRKVGSFRQIETEVPSLKSQVTSEQPATSSQEQVAREENKQKEKDLKHFQHQIARTEKQIEKFESEIKAIDEKLSNPELYQQTVSDKDFFSNYEKLKKQLEEEMKKWEELQSKLPV
ncbi:MAG: ABC-F family ATP-binding cassette domain-containing protein [Bacteroidetes bacterium]|nr:ABC-F family ATP-binding cassette domain-containing protein [Bacteroidota bacterium]